MISLFPIDEVWPICPKACLDTFGEHVVHYKELPKFKYRRDFVRDVIFYMLRRAGVSVKNETYVNFLLTHKKEDRHLVEQILWCTGG